MDTDGARIVRVNRGTDKRADRPETDGKALALFGNVPPAIEFAAQPPAGTVFAQEKPFVPMYGPETFSSNTGREVFHEYLVSALGTAPSPAPVATSEPDLVVAATPVAPSLPPSRLSEETHSTPTPRPRSEVTFSIQPRQQPQRASGPSLLDQLAELESQGESSSPKPPPRPSPRAGTAIARRPAPSLFIERRKPKKPAQKPDRPQGPPGGNGCN